MHFEPEYMVSIFDAADEVSNLLAANLVPYLHGSPGIGKSAVAKQVAAKHNLKLIDIRVTSLDPCDFNGLPDLSGNRAVFKQFDQFPLDDDELPLKKKGETSEQDEYYDGWLVLLDEFSSADEQRQGAAYKFVLDRQVGHRNLHPRVRIMAAGNLSTDGAIVNTLSSALISRFAHMAVKCDLKKWIDEVAYPRKMDTRLSMFLQFKPNAFYTFDPNNPERAYACPRTWEYAAKYLKQLGETSTSRGNELSSFVRRRAMAGIIGEGVADELHSFLKYQDKLPSREQVLNNPDSVIIDQSNIGVIFALSGMLADLYSKETEVPVMKVVNRLSADFAVVTLRAVIKRIGTSAFSYPELSRWMSNNVDLIA